MKIDFKKSLDSYKAKKGEYRILEIPPLQYVMIDGQGDPNTAQDYKHAIEALYSVAYKIKFMSKQTLDKDYVVPPLEALWWSEDMDSFTVSRDKSKWSWTAMIMTPDWITREMFESAVQTVIAKSAPASIDKIKLETLSEETVVQTLHVGSYDDEAPTLKDLHENLIPDNGYRMTKKHHEMYLSDFRKVEPNRLRTILRQPIKRI